MKKLNSTTAKISTIIKAQREEVETFVWSDTDIYERSFYAR